MSSFCTATGPLESRRKSSSASTSTSMDAHLFTHGQYHSPPLPTALAPLHLTRRDKHIEWRQDGYVDDLVDSAYIRLEHATRPCSRTNPPYMRQSLPPPMTKFATHALWSDAPSSYSSSPFSSALQTSSLFPQGDSAIADEGEEYDLESMNIHIRETYFATSAERGRWLSSPVAPRLRSQATPMRGHSSPIKSLADESPLRQRARKHKISRSFGEQSCISSSKDHDKDLRYSSPLPPSSPIASPMSNISFLTDHEGDSVVDPHSNSDDCHSLCGTPELSISSTACTSPVEPTRTPASQEASTSAAAHRPTDSPPHSVHSIISRHTIPNSPVPLDVNVHASCTTDFELDEVLSPLSQFELDLPEAEPPKLPLSDTVNKPHPGVNFEAAPSQAGTPSIQSLSMISNHEPRDCSGSSSKAKRGSATGNPEARRAGKRVDIRSRSPSSDTKRRSGTESRLSNRPEPPSKKSRLSRCRGDSESRGTRSLARRGGIPKMKRVSRSPSHPAVEGGDLESSSARDRMTSKRAQSPQPASDPSATLVPTHSVNAEFHAALTGMLIEALATSRATSMDAPTLYLVVTQAHPYITNERPKAELLMDMTTVLESGRTQCGMFQKVDGSGERLRNKSLESRWFYVPEQDEDRERASLISAIMPRQKRNETKKYKQYYYRPLDKMSRWDPEDAP